MLQKIKSNWLFVGLYFTFLSLTSTQIWAQEVTPLSEDNETGYIEVEEETGGIKEIDADSTAENLFFDLGFGLVSGTIAPAPGAKQKAEQGFFVVSFSLGSQLGTHILGGDLEGYMGATIRYPSQGNTSEEQLNSTLSLRPEFRYVQTFNHSIQLRLAPTLALDWNRMQWGVATVQSFAPEVGLNSSASFTPWKIFWDLIPEIRSYVGLNMLGRWSADSSVVPVEKRMNQEPLTTSQFKKSGSVVNSWRYHAEIGLAGDSKVSSYRLMLRFSKLFMTYKSIKEITPTSSASLYKASVSDGPFDLSSFQLIFSRGL